MPASAKWFPLHGVRYEPIDSQFFIRNRERLRSLLKPNSIVILRANDILPTNADGTMAFKQNTDLFYLTGVDQEDTVLVMMQIGRAHV